MKLAKMVLNIRILLRTITNGYERNSDVCVILLHYLKSLFCHGENFTSDNQNFSIHGFLQITLLPPGEYCSIIWPKSVNVKGIC